MDIILRVVGHVEIEDVGHVRNIQAARGNIARHQDRQLAFAERIERRGTDLLRQVAVQGGGVEAVSDEPLFQDVHVALAVAKDQGAGHGFGADDPAQGCLLVAFRHDGDHIRDHHRRRRGPVDRDFLRIDHVGVGQPADFGRHRGAEQHRLAQRRQLFDDAFDIRNEAHVEHPVGFVDHEDLHVAQYHLAAFDLVEQPARRGDQDVDAAVEQLVLAVEAFAADQQGMGQPVVLAVFLETFGDLGRQFAGRLQDQRPGHPRLGAACGQNVDHRQGKAGGLAGAGLRQPDHVAPHQDGGDRFFLDRCGYGIAGIGDRTQNGVAQA